jgi:hypothetical protein
MWRGRKGDIYRELGPGEIQSVEDCEYPLSKMLPILDNHSLIDEIIIINNDDAKCPEWFSSTKWNHVVEINCGRNIYVNPAWELGIRAAKNDKICLMNDDVWWDKSQPLLETLHDEVVPEKGCIGLDNSCYFTIVNNSEKIKVKDVKYLREEDSWMLGYGCLMFLNRKNFKPFPPNLSIYYGDYVINKTHMDEGKISRGIFDFAVRTNSASTTSSEEFNPIKEKDLQVFAEYMNQDTWWTYYSNTVTKLTQGLA